MSSKEYKNKARIISEENKKVITKEQNKSREMADKFKKNTKFKKLN